MTLFFAANFFCIELCHPFGIYPFALPFFYNNFILSGLWNQFRPTSYYQIFLLALSADLGSFV